MKQENYDPELHNPFIKNNIDRDDSKQKHKTKSLLPNLRDTLLI